MSDSRVQVGIVGGVDQFRREEQVVDAATLKRAVSLAADDAILVHDLRWLQCDIPATDYAAMAALHCYGFRREGRLRSAPFISSGYLMDALIYARLAVDPVYGPHGFSGVMNSVLSTRRVIAHIVFRDETGQVLFIETAYKGDWELPGGVADPDESPCIGGRRELLGKIGLDTALGEPAITDWMSSHLSWGDAIEFIYDGDVLSGTVTRRLALRGRELRVIHWVPREELLDRVNELSARRINLFFDGYRGAMENGTWIL